MNRPRSVWTDALHVAVLCVFAVAQPLLDLMGGKPEFLAVRGLSPLGIVLLTLVLCLAVPLPLMALELVVQRAVPRLQPALHVVVCTLLVAMIALPPLGRSSLPPVLASGLALLLGMGAGWALHRWRPARLFLAYLTPAVLLFPVLFWLRPGVTTLLQPGPGAATTATASASTPTSLADEQATNAGPAPIVLVVFDELPVTSLLDTPTTIDARAFPHFAAFAAEATWYRYTAAASDFTVLAVPAIFTGSTPVAGRLPIATDHPRSVFTLLEGRYAMNVSEALTHVCPARLCGDRSGSALARGRTLANDLGLLYLHLVLPAAWAEGLPSVTENWMFFGGVNEWRESWHDRGRGDQPNHVERFLAGIHPTDKPVLHVLHVLLPHPPFLYLPTGQAYSTHGDVVGLERDNLPDDAEAVRQIHQRHLLQTGFADTVLGRVRARLVDVGLWDRAVVAVVADHGASFVPGGRRRSVSRKTFGDVVPVPMLIKAAGQQAGRLDPRQASVIDVVPTVLDLANVAHTADDFDGRSFADPNTPGREYVTVIPYRQRQAKPRIYRFDALRAAEHQGLTLRNRRFGTGDSRRLFGFGPHAALIGQAVDDLPGGTLAPFAADLRLPWNALDLGPDPPFVPAHIHGRLMTTKTATALAVSINGRVAGTTRTWSWAPDRWSVVVDPVHFRPGANDVAVHWLEDQGNGAVLRPVRLIQDQLSLIQQSRGLHAAETWPSGRIRWTDGDAELHVVFNSDQPPRALDLTVVATPPDGTRLRVTINGVQRFAGNVSGIDPERPWHRTLSLDGIPMTDRLIVRLESESHVPNARFDGEVDTRRLGVAVAGVALVDS